MRSVTITYNELYQAKAAFDVLGKLSKGLKPDMKMLIAKTLRSVAGDRDDLEEKRSEIALRLTDIGWQRQKDEVMARAAMSDDPAIVKKAEAAAAAIAKPTAVMQPELAEYQLEFSAILKPKVELNLPSDRLKTSALLKFEEFLPEHAAALYWLLEDDISAPEKDEEPPQPAVQAAPADSQEEEKA